MGKKGLSLEEKRKKMLEILYETKDFYLLKELEKIAPKKKGIIAQSVKDVLQSLVDDNLVDTDKIGTSVYFWAFPSKALALRKARLSELQDKLAAAKSKSEGVDEILKEAQSGKDESDDRNAILEELSELEAKKAELAAKLKKYEGCDPEVLVQLEGQTKMAKEAVNRWTDNIFSAHSWIGKRFPHVEVSQLNKQYEIPEELDYIE
eukprot:07048.XXX_255200_255817_1 [CDS] Oithona nana genome sequencing.